MKLTATLEQAGVGRIKRSASLFEVGALKFMYNYALRSKKKVRKTPEGAEPSEVISFHSILT